MTIRIEIFGETASEALDELKIIASALTSTKTPNVGNAPEPTATLSPASSNSSYVETISEAEKIEEVLQEVIAEEPATDAEVDANGIPFNPALHTGTKKKDGTWRMKKGAETPSSTSTASPASETVDTVTAPAGSSQTEEPASAVASQDDDEFAAFAAAAAKADAVEAKVPERVWTDADLGALCNQAAVKLGNPAPVKEQIAKFVPEGEVAHSRNVPADKRAEFVKAVEAAAGIEFAG